MKRLYLVGYSLIVVLLLAVSCTKEAEILTGSIYGEVTDAQTGEPIQGVQISLTPGGVTATTGSDGSYEFLNLDVAQYRLQAKKTDYLTETKRVTVVVGQSVSGDMVLTPVQKLELNATSLNFGKENTSLSFDIKNKGTSKFNWNISGLNNVDWIEVNPVSGALDGGKSCTVQVTVLREKLAESKDLTLIVNADKESVSLKVNVEVEKKVAKIEVEPTTLDFGEDESVMTFNVKNVGNAGKIDWNITGLDVDWIKIDPMKGSLEENKTQAVKVSLARELVKEKVKTTVLINAAGESFPIEILAEESKKRYIVANPVAVSLGERNEETLTLFSYNGSTNYSVVVKEANIGWLNLSKTSGTIPQYDAANPAMKETIGLSVNRNNMSAGEYSCTLIIRSDLGDLEVPVSMTVKDVKFEVSPTQLVLGSDKNNASFSMYSTNGDTAYELLIKESDATWLTLNKKSGVVKNGVVETVDVAVKRDGLSAGNYSATIIVRTSLGDTEISVTMTVEEGASSTVTGTIISCHDDLEFTLLSCKISGTTATLEMTVKNIGNNTHFLRLYGGQFSYAFDDQGYKYHDSDLTVSIAGSSYSTHSAYTEIPADVMTKCTIKINNVDESAAVFGNISIDTDDDYGLILENIVIEGRTSVALPSPQTSGTVVSFSEDIEVLLIDCKTGTNYTTLSLQIKNIGKSSTLLYLYGGQFGYAYDEKGNKYHDSDLNVAFSGSSYSSHSSYTKLPSGIMTNAYIRIANVDVEAKEFTNITLDTNYENDLVFKNVKIRK